MEHVPEWPIESAEAAPRDTAPPAIDAAAIAAIVASPAAGAMLQRRIEHLTRFGHSPQSDAEQPIVKLLHIARNYIGDACDCVGNSDGNGLAEDRRAVAQLKVEKAGAMLMSAFDQIRQAGQGNG